MAVAYFVFNRPELTKQSWAAIRNRRPERLLVVADGPRPGHQDDLHLCEKTRDVVANVDWDCEVRYEMADENLGLRKRIISGLSLAFDLSDRVVVLEDDCVASPDFFLFSESLLDHYATEPRVMAITGDNFQGGRRRGDASYYFSKYFHCWGWASWTRTWKSYDPDLEFWPSFIQSKEWQRLMPQNREAEFWVDMIERVRTGSINTWDFQYQASIWRNGGLTATPNSNLTHNIGFGPAATNTTQKPGSLAPETAVLGSLTHPNELQQDQEADEYTFKNHFQGQGRLQGLRSKAGQFIRSGVAKQTTGEREGM